LDWCDAGIYVPANVLLCSRVYSQTRNGSDFRVVADSPGSFVSAVPLCLTILAVVLFPTFLFWERRQEKLQKTCIMPLVVWKNRSFAAVCVAVFLAWAAFNGVQYFATLTYSLPRSD